MYDSINTMLNANADTEDSDDEFTLKDVVDKNVGSILDAATSADDEDDDDEVIFFIFIFFTGNFKHMYHTERIFSNFSWMFLNPPKKFQFEF